MIALEDLVRRFEDNNGEYLKIHQTVKDKVGSTLSDGKGLLRLALYSLIESIRKEPVKYSSLIYNSNSISLPGQHQYISSQDYFTEHYTAMLVQEAEKLYNKLIKEITKGIIYDPSFSSSISSSPLLSSTDETTTRSSSSPPSTTTAQY